MTIDLFGAAKKLNLDQTAIGNLEMLTEIRDACVHFHPGDGLKELVFNLGAAALRNYVTLVQQWFKRSLGKYDFFILPMGFSHGFVGFDGTAVAGIPKELARIFQATKQKQQALAASSGDFLFACEIDIHLRSSKKYAGDATAIVKVDPSATTGTVVVQEKRKLDQYPLSYKEVIAKVRERLPEVKQGAIDGVIRREKVKSNSRLSVYSFLKKADENRYLNTGAVKPGTTSIYNHDAVECQRALEYRHCGRNEKQPF